MPPLMSHGPPVHRALAQMSIQAAAPCRPGLPLSADGTVAPILRGVDLDLDTRAVALKPGKGGKDAMRLVEVYHDNNPEFSSDTRVWECGIVLARCLDPAPTTSGSLVRRDLLEGGTDADEAPRGEAPGAAVLDLGSGTGVVGLAAAWLGAASLVFLTEMERVVPLLEFNARLNADGRFNVVGHSGDSPPTELDSAKHRNLPAVHVHPLDWREPQTDNTGCKFSVTRALAAHQTSRCFDRVTVIASDCVYSPREVDDFMTVLRNLAEDMSRIPGIRAFELIVAIKLRLYSETNRSAVVKFLGEMGAWLTPSNSDFGPETSEPVWQSAERTLEEVRKGNYNDDLAERCSLSAQRAADASLPAHCVGTHHLVLEDVKWKHRTDLFSDLKPKKIEDICIFRISCEDAGTRKSAGTERG